MAHRYYRATDADGAAVTGDAANHTLKLVNGAAISDPTNSPSELVYGFYALELDSEETADFVIGESSTDDVTLWPVARLPEFSATVAGRIDQTLTALGAAIRGADSDTLKTLSDEIAATCVALAGDDSRDLTEVYDAIPASLAGDLEVTTISGGTNVHYTANAEIVRGGRWPAGSGTISLQLTKSGGWPASVESWTWSLLLSRYQGGGAADLAIEADAVSLSGSTLTVTFYATPTQTASLGGSGRTKFAVELKSEDGSGVVSYYDQVEGYAWVRTRAGDV